MIRKPFANQFLAPLLIGVAILLVAVSVEASEPLNLFDSEAAASQRCGGDVIVWLDVPTNSYRFKGEPGYGESKQGGYTCKEDADRSGNRARSQS